MATGKVPRGKRFPPFALDSPLCAFSGSRRTYAGYVSVGQVAADLGRRPGYYALALAEAVGPTGRVYSG